MTDSRELAQTPPQSSKIAPRNRSDEKSDLGAVLQTAKPITDPVAFKRPSAILPETCRAPVYKLWLANSHLFPKATALAASIRLWIEDHGFHPDDVEPVCRILLTPEKRAGHRFAADLLADLAQLVADAIRRRKALEEQRRRREADEVEKEQAVISESMRGFWAGLTRGIGQ